MEPESPSPLSQQHSTCLYPEPDQWSPYPKLIFWSSSLILSSHPCLGLPSRFFPSGFPSKPYVYMHLSLIHTTYITHIIFFIRSVQFMNLFIIQYNLTKIILQSVADHNCDLRSTAVCFASAATEASNKTFHWLITSHPNLTCPAALTHFTIFHLYQIFHVPLIIVCRRILIFNVQARLLKNIT